MPTACLKDTCTISGPPTWMSWQGGADTAWDLIAPAACELLDDAEVAGLLARLGPSPQCQDADAGRAWASLQGERTAYACPVDQPAA
jgi:hypothetical protein